MTPILTRERRVARLDDNLFIQREGGRKHEWYLVRGFVLCHALDDARQICPLITSPVPLAEGKDNWAVLSVTRGRVPNLIAEGHRGIGVVHFAWGGALIHVMTRRMT